jgi:hypothetical protein
MSLAQKLINRTGALARKIKRNPLINFEDVNEQTSVLSKSRGAQKLILSSQRQTDLSFGLAVEAQKIEVAQLLASDAALSIVSGHLQAVINNIGTTEIVQYQALADAPSGITQVSTVSCVADDGGSLNNNYFLLNSVNNELQFYIWFNVNGGGVDPMVSGATGIPISIYTNAPAAVVANAIALALTAYNSGAVWTATSSGAVVTITYAAVGPANIPMTGKPYSGETGFSFAISTLGQNPLSLNDKYFVLYDMADTNGVAVWYNVNGGGTAPGGYGRTIEVSVASLASAATVASATAAALHADSVFAPSGHNGTLIVAASNQIGQFGPPNSGTSTFLMTELQKGNSDIENFLLIEATDLAEVLSGELIGNFYTISSVAGNVITFEQDVAGYGGETDISLRFEMRTTIPQILYPSSDQV